MSTVAKQAGVRLLRALGKHADLIIDAYTSPTGGILESEDNIKAIDELCRHRLLQRDDKENLVRLRTPMRNLLNQGLSTTRLQMVNANIGQSVESIQMLAEQYRASKKAGEEASSIALLQSLRENVFTLADDLSDLSRDIWQQINSDFGIASQLSTKIALNAAALNRVKKTQEALILVDMDGLYDTCKADRELMSSVYSRLRLARENCFQELGDAIGRLNKMMFNLKRLERRAKQISRLAAHYRNHPDFQPEGYALMREVPGIFMLGEPMSLARTIDPRSESLELEHAEMLIGLRREEVPDEGVARKAEPVKARLDDAEVMEVAETEFKKAVRELFFECLQSSDRLSAMQSFDPDVAGNDPELWLFAVLSEHSSDVRLRKAVSLEYVGEYSREFNGNFMAEDVILCRN